MGKKLFRRNKDRSVKKAQEYKEEINKIYRVVTFVIEDCTRCPALNKISLQSGQFLIQCTKKDNTMFTLSSPQLLKDMFDNCGYWPEQIKKENKEKTKESMEEAMKDLNVINKIKTENKKRNNNLHPIQSPPRPIE